MVESVIIAGLYNADSSSGYAASNNRLIDDEVGRDEDVA
jgi:hypothetical protein